MGVLEPMEVDVSSTDFSMAHLSPEAANILKQNCAIIPPENTLQ